MAINYVQPGDVLEYTAPAGGVTSGQGYLIGATFVVAVTTAAAGEKFRCRVSDVWMLPKVAAQAQAEGVVVYWDNAARNVTTTVGSNTKIGVVARAALAADATVRVRLNGAF
jgi:predicted RecA/RadA family phage recombinase